MPKQPNPERIDDDAPELGEAFFAKARPTSEVMGAAFMEKAKRAPGRPKAEEPKEPVSLRLSQNVLRHLRSTGPGWQTRVDSALSRLIQAGQL